MGTYKRISTEERFKKIKTQRKPTYISLFSSAGVGCYGFKQNNYACIATCELLPERIQIQKVNKKCDRDSGYICGDITKNETKEKLFSEINHYLEINNEKDIDVVFATPPCQGMSTANCKKTDEEQVRNSLVVEAIKIIQKIQPKIFVFENVRAFMKTICTDIDGENIQIGDCIDKHLENDYYIYSKILNFKDYGVPSSRPRTIVIGTRRDLHNISPLNLFPVRQDEITLRESIGGLHKLDFGEKDRLDPLHFARTYDRYMEDWIRDLREGESAFSNPDERKPYKILPNGEKQILKSGEMGNKFRRLRWDKPCSCVATRNDQLASNDTIHPRDNRVLSIRELMKVMTIPDQFQWTKDDTQLTVENANKYLQENELNIRRCIGEAVPTHIIFVIAKKIKEMLFFEQFVELYDKSILGNVVNDQSLMSQFYINTFIKEQQISDAKSSGSFYTPQCVVFDTIKGLELQSKSIRILEPSVGLGAFIPQLCAEFSEKDEINIDTVEIDADVITSLQESLKLLDLGVRTHINYFCSDFLEYELNGKYDAVVTNPPYALSKKKYDTLTNETKMKNLFGLFLLKINSVSKNIACVIPKNFVMADEFSELRKLYEKFKIVSICDFGVNYFKEVFVEIISIHFSQTYNGPLVVNDYVNHEQLVHKQGYIFHDKVWLIYRNKFFDEFIATMELDTFSSFRDRQITNKMLNDSNGIRVLRSKNLQDDGSIIDIQGYDKYIDGDITNLKVAQYMNKKPIIMVNFTYNTRAGILPENTLPNGSIAILEPKTVLYPDNLKFYSTKEFRKYYEIVKSRSRYTLNIDNSSLYYIGINKQ